MVKKINNVFISTMKKIMCQIGLHVMENHHHNFVDRVSGKMVYNADCACGKSWMVDSLNPVTFFRVERDVGITKLSKEKSYIITTGSGICGRIGQYELTTIDGKSHCFFMHDTCKYEFFPVNSKIKEQ